MPTEMKDGVGNEFTLRTKDVSGGQNNAVRQNWHLATRYPVEHASGGAFHTTMKSNTMTAALAANSTIAMFRFVSPSLICVLRHLDLSMWSVTAIAAGFLSFDAFVARAFTGEDTGGLLAPLAGNVGKLRTSHQSPLAHLRVSDTGQLTVGTRTLDGAPFENITAGLAASGPINNVYFLNQPLFTERDHPMVLKSEEGVVIQANVPATGTWAFNVTAVWDEIEANNY